MFRERIFRRSTSGNPTFWKIRERLSPDATSTSIVLIAGSTSTNFLFDSGIYGRGSNGQVGDTPCDNSAFSSTIPLFDNLGKIILSFGPTIQLAALLKTIGSVGNKSHENISIGKAGRSRWLGRRPKVRGVAMNPVDHPHGGGEGKTSGGRHPVSPWGTPAKGYRTRKKNKASNKYIVKRRK